jgi:hypothetical protein
LEFQRRALDVSRENVVLRRLVRRCLRVLHDTGRELCDTLDGLSRGSNPSCRATRTELTRRRRVWHYVLSPAHDALECANDALYSDSDA